MSTHPSIELNPAARPCLTGKTRPGTTGRVLPTWTGPNFTHNLHISHTHHPCHSLLTPAESSTEIGVRQQVAYVIHAGDNTEEGTPLSPSTGPLLGNDCQPQNRHPRSMVVDNLFCPNLLPPSFRPDKGERTFAPPRPRHLPQTISHP